MDDNDDKCHSSIFNDQTSRSISLSPMYPLADAVWMKNEVLYKAFIGGYLDISRLIIRGLTDQQFHIFASHCN